MSEHDPADAADTTEADAASHTPLRDGDEPSTGSDAAETRESEDENLELAARAELLAEENRRLRAEYTRARRSEYRRTAYGLALLGVLAFVAGLAFPDGREILFALGFTGLFGGVLTLYLTPEQVVAADVGERVYAALAANDAALATQLGLGDERVYLPGDDAPAHLYVPRWTEYDRPALDEGPLVVDEQSRGLLLEATGAFLFEEFERVTDDLAATPAALATQLAEGITEVFELAGAIDTDVDPRGGRATVRVSDSAFGDPDRFDHPLASFLAVGFAAGLDRPVTLEVDPGAGDDRADWLVTCRWSVDESA